MNTINYLIQKTMIIRNDKDKKILIAFLFIINK